MVYIKSDISTHFKAINNLDSESVNLYQDLLAVKEKECKNLKELVFELIGEIERLQKELKVKKGAK